MNDIAKYKLELISKDDTYTKCRIGGLKNAYYKCEWKNDKLETFGGICGLLKNEEYKGYCNLCMTYHKNKSDELPAPGYIVEFSPLYNELGQMILIEYDRDEICTSLDRGGYPKSWNDSTLRDAELTFWNNGTFEEFTK